MFVSILSCSWMDCWTLWSSVLPWLLSTDGPGLGFGTLGIGRRGVLTGSGMGGLSIHTTAADARSMVTMVKTQTHAALLHILRREWGPSWEKDVLC